MNSELSTTICQNYRDKFQNQYGREYPGTDRNIRRMAHEIGVLSTSAEQDAAILEEMARAFYHKVA